MRNRPPRGFVSRTIAEACDAVGICVWRDMSRENIFAVTCDEIRLCDRCYFSQAIPSIWNKKKRSQVTVAITRAVQLLRKGNVFFRMVLVRGAGEFDDESPEGMRCFFDDVADALSNLNRRLKHLGVELVVVAENVSLRLDGQCSPHVHLLFAIRDDRRREAEKLRTQIATEISSRSLRGINFAVPQRRGRNLLVTPVQVERHIQYLYSYPLKLYDNEHRKVMLCDGMRAFLGQHGNREGVSAFCVLNALMAFASVSPAKGANGKFRFVMRQGAPARSRA